MKTTRVLTLLAAFFALTLSVCAYDFKSGDLYYNITRNTDPYIVEVTYQYPPGEPNNYSGLKVADIPSTVSYGGKTYSVMSIGSTAFTECTSLTSVSIPESVLSIEFFAFYGCANLETAYFMGNAPLMSDGVFEGCASSFSVRYLANKSGFTDSWEGYTAVTFSEPAEITIIDPSPYVWISISVFILSITLLIIIRFKKKNPSKFISIIRVILLSIFGLFLFVVLSGLFLSFIYYVNYKDFSYRLDEIVTIGNVKYMIGHYRSTNSHDYDIETAMVAGNSAQSKSNICSEFTELDILSTVNYDGKTYDVTLIQLCSFEDRVDLTSITIPSSVTSIGMRAFQDCSALTSIMIPSSVTEIGQNAFTGTPWYNNKPDGLVYINNVFYECKGSMSFLTAPFRGIYMVKNKISHYLPTELKYYPQEILIDETEEDFVYAEDFNSFFRHFKRDSVFQKSRIIFPLTNVYLDAPDYKIQIITDNEWVYNSLDWDPTYVERDEDAYNQEILIESDTAKIKYLGTNNGINCEYIYICKNGEWFLYKIIDRSM